MKKQQNKSQGMHTKKFYLNEFILHCVKCMMNLTKI